MIEGPYDPDRARLHAMVDEWIDNLNEEPAHSDNQRIEVAVVGGICRGTDADGDDVEAPSYQADPRSVWQQIGLLTCLLDAAKHGHYESADD